MFEGILGASDRLIVGINRGQIEKTVADMVVAGRTEDEIQEEFKGILSIYKLMGKNR